MTNKKYKNLIEYLIDEENLSFKDAATLSRDYNNDLDKYLEAFIKCDDVKIYDIGDAYSVVCCNDKGMIIYGAEFNFDNNDVFDYMSINDLEYKLNQDLALLSSSEIEEIIFEQIEELTNDLILQDEGSVYTWDHIDYVNDNGGLFECLKGACCEYGYNICDISDENSAYSLAYAWAYDINKPYACLAYLEKQGY